MNNVVLEVENLRKEFKDFTAVDNLSFSIRTGEVLGLLGPNGAGKTTTIQMLLGVMDATGGSINYFGLPFSKNREKILAKINFSSTYISMPWHFTVDEILDVYARLYEIADRKKRIDDLLGGFELTHLRKKQFTVLSAGEKTRLFLAKAFLNYPRVILLDEPTASLDPDIAVKIREFLKKEKAERNISMLLTSHNMSEVEEMCDRVMIMKSGKVVDHGRPENLAKKIHNCRIELLILKKKHATDNYFRDKKLNYKADGDRYTIFIDEKRIAGLLHDLVLKDIRYEEIAISKPKLEDYFLEVLKEKIEV